MNVCEAISLPSLETLPDSLLEPSFFSDTTQQASPHTYHRSIYTQIRSR